jgi:threonine/homoserine/homoserine lactone efflux protein
MTIEGAIARRREAAIRNIVEGSIVTVAVPVLAVAGIVVVHVESLAVALFMLACAGAVVGPWLAIRSGLLELRRATRDRRALDDARLPRATLRR